MVCWLHRVIGRQLNIYASDYELLSNDSDDSYSSHTCPTYADCADDAFDVDLPPNAFAGLYLPGLTDFEISDSAGPGTCFLAPGHSGQAASMREHALSPTHCAVVSFAELALTL